MSTEQNLHLIHAKGSDALDSYQSYLSQPARGFSWISLCSWMKQDSAFCFSVLLFLFFCFFFPQFRSTDCAHSRCDRRRALFDDQAIAFHSSTRASGEHQGAADARWRD
jgi:hypothetical protein